MHGGGHRENESLSDLGTLGSGGPSTRGGGVGLEIRRVYMTDFCNSLQQVLLRAVLVCFKKYIIISNIISIVIAIVIVIAAVIAIFVA